MSRLRAEQQRLYLLQEASSADHTSGRSAQTRAMVLGVQGSGTWAALSRAWRGVQADLQWPAPAIAVTGEGYELWFSTAEPTSQARASAAMEALRKRYLADLPVNRVRVSAGDAWDRMPPRQLGPDRWCAFIAADLAAVFESDPWLDVPPGADAQAELLSGLASIGREELEQLAGPESPAVFGPTAVARVAGSPGSRTAELSVVESQHGDARAFLVTVMNDASAPLHLRVEAAKVLLRHAD